MLVGPACRAGGGGRGGGDGVDRQAHALLEKRRMLIHSQKKNKSGASTCTFYISPSAQKAVNMYIPTLQGAAPGTHEMAGAFFKRAKKKFECVQIPQHTLSQEYRKQSCVIHAMRLKGALPVSSPSSVAVETQHKKKLKKEKKAKKDRKEKQRKASEKGEQDEGEKIKKKEKKGKHKGKLGAELGVESEGGLRRDGEKIKESDNDEDKRKRKRTCVDDGDGEKKKKRKVPVSGFE